MSFAKIRINVLILGLSALIGLITLAALEAWLKASFSDAVWYGVGGISTLAKDIIGLEKKDA